jgi:MFS family permease
MNGYTLTLAAFLLIGGSLGDRSGRRTVYLAPSRIAQPGRERHH